MIYSDRLGDQTDQNEYSHNSQNENENESGMNLNSNFFLDDYKDVGDNKTRKSDQQLGLIQLENVKIILINN